MNPILLAQALVVVIILPAFAAWAQDTGISLPDLSSLPPLGSRTEHFQRNDDVLKKIIDGKYSPEIYRVNDDDDDEKRLSKQQINCLYAECAMFQARFEQGAGTLDALVVDARRRLGDAKLEFHVEPEEKRKVLTEPLEDAKKLE